MLVLCVYNRVAPIDLASGLTKGPSFSYSLASSFLCEVFLHCSSLAFLRPLTLNHFKAVFKLWVWLRSRQIKARRKAQQGCVAIVRRVIHRPGATVWLQVGRVIRCACVYCRCLKALVCSRSVAPPILQYSTAAILITKQRTLIEMMSLMITNDC